MAINCLGNLCSKTGPKFHSLHVQVLDVLIPNLDYFGPGSVGADGDVPHKMALAKVRITCSVIHFCLRQFKTLITCIVEFE